MSCTNLNDISQSCLEIIMEADKVNVKTIGNFDMMDTLYTLTVTNIYDSTITKTFVPGVEIIVDDPNKELRISFDGTMSPGVYEGYLESNSKAESVYLKIKIVLDLK